MSESILHAQEVLGSTLARAQAEEDRELARMVREVGATLVVSLNGLLRMSRTHALTNTAFDAPVRDFRARLDHLLDLLGPVHVLSVEEQVYVNEIRIRFEAAMEQGLALHEEFGKHGVGGITFNASLGDEQAREMVRLFALEPAEASPRAALQQGLASFGMESVELLPVLQFRVSGEQDERLEGLRDALEASAGVLAEAFASVGSARLPNPLQARRVVTFLIDALEAEDIMPLVMEHEEAMPPFARHTLMVTSLSLLIGRHVGLSRASLADLGVAAMLHDAGFCMTEKGSSVSFARHTRAAIPVLLRQRGFYRAKVRRMLTVLEHHRACNDPVGVPSLFARIVHIADDYDILTRHRPGKGPAMAPSEAMTRMAAQGFKLYDGDLLQAFVNALGPYPPGSLLRLADGRVVRSVSAVRSPETFRTPLVRLVRRADGAAVQDGPVVDLGQAAQIVAVLPGNG